MWIKQNKKKQTANAKQRNASPHQRAGRHISAQDVEVSLTMLVEEEREKGKKGRKAERRAER